MPSTLDLNLPRSHGVGELMDSISRRDRGITIGEEQEQSGDDRQILTEVVEDTFIIAMDGKTPSQAAGAEYEYAMSVQVRGRWRGGTSWGLVKTSLLAMLVFMMLLGPSRAAWVTFQNCLTSDITDPTPGGKYHLQWVPSAVWAELNQTNKHTLNLTVYGDVKGQFTQGNLEPLSNKTYWNNPNNTFGKIVDLDPANNKYTTLFGRYQVLSYVPWSEKGVKFCDTLQDTECPVGPVLNNTNM